MFRVYIDYDHASKSGKIMHSPELASAGFVLIDPICTRELNGAGELTFGIANDHPYRYAFKRMSTIFTVIWSDDLYNETSLWQGRCYSDETDQYGTCTVTCEGEYAYFNDTFTFESDPDGVYEPEEEEEPIDVRIPLWMYVAGIVAEHNVESLPDKQIMFDAIVDITSINTSLSLYTGYATTWLQQSGCSIWSYAGLYPLITAKWAHVYLSKGWSNKLSCVTIVAVPDGMSEFQRFYGCDIEPKDDPTVELKISSHDKHKNVLENFQSEYGGYFNVSDHWVAWTRRTTWEQQHDPATAPYRSPFVEIEGVGSYMPVLTYLREPADYIYYEKLTFGSEISDLSINAECDEIVNVLIPTASEVGDEEEDPANYWDGTLKSVNSNLEYIKADTSIETFGQIWGTNDWGDDVKDPNTLMIRGISYLEEHMAPKWTVDMKVIDPAFADLSRNALQFGNRYPVYVEPLDMDTSFILIREKLHLADPSKNEYEFFTELGVFTDVELQNGGKDEYRMNAAYATYRQGFINKYSSTTSGFYRALLAAMQNATAIPMDAAYGANRINLDDSRFLQATESVTWQGQYTYLCNMYYFYPTVSPWCRNTPFGSASFILIVLYNSSTGHIYQVAFNPFSYTYILYREFSSGSVLSQIRSLTTIWNTTNTRNWSPINGINWPDKYSGGGGGTITISSQPANFVSSSGTRPYFSCQASGAGIKFTWYGRISSTGKWYDLGSLSSYFSGGYTNTVRMITTAYDSTQMVGAQVRCKITDSYGTSVYTNTASIV